METGKNTFRNLILLAFLGAGGYGVYKFGIYKGWWVPKKWLQVDLEWAFLFKLPLEIDVQGIQDLFVDRFNTMQGKKWPLKQVKSISASNQSIYFPKIYSALKSASTVTEFKNALLMLPYQYNYAQLNDWLNYNYSKVIWDFLNDKLNDQEIANVVTNTFLTKPSGAAFFTDKNGNYIWEKNLWIYK